MESHYFTQTNKYEDSTIDNATTNSMIYSEQKRVTNLLGEIVNNEPDITVMPLVPAKQIRTASTVVIDEIPPKPKLQDSEARPNSNYTI
jgi:hypothetical protein